MVSSFYNTQPYSQKHHGINLPYSTAQPWFTSSYHPHPPNHQFLGEDSPHHHPQHMYYAAPHMFHQASAGDWHVPENFQNTAQAHMLQQHSNVAGGNTQLNDSTSSTGENNNNNNNNNNNTAHIAEGLPSPPITVSGSEISSPGAPASSSSPHPITNINGNHTNNNNNNHSNNNNNHRTSPVKSPYYEWMKKPSYPTQPTPGKTRTKDKYRVVYTDYQRLELEKEYCTSRYITIRRKTELAQSLQLSERQVKIWFQNRRAKERKQNKKRDDPLIGQNPDLSNYMDTKPKIEPSLHFKHSLHQMGMSMSPPFAIHHLHHGHHPLVPPPQHLHQSHAHTHSHSHPHPQSHSHSQMSSSPNGIGIGSGVGVGVGALSM